ncbi:MAG: dTDP-4-dehydrorhamnose reductase [Candidatus Binatia bacterium]
MRVAVLGSTGQLGRDLVEILQKSGKIAVASLSHQDADCTRVESLRAALARIQPQALINCAAFVRVDDCEDQAPDAFEVNALGALNVARACAEIDATCVHVSTDYVFDGGKAGAYVESDVTFPINIYGASKLAGELLVRQTAPRWLIFRVASLFGKAGARGKGGNFIETILHKAREKEPLRIVDDIRVSPTYTRDAAGILCKLLQADITGIIHSANAGSCTWYEFARAALTLCRLDTPVEAVASSAYPTRARRPSNSALASERLADLVNTPMPSWQAALRAYLIEKGHIQ